MIVDQAERHLRSIDEWWRAHHRAGANVFLDEFDRAMRLLSVTPEIGPRFTRSRRPGVRRLLLRRSQHYVYYVFDRARSVVYVLAIWSTARGAAPPVYPPGAGPGAERANYAQPLRPRPWYPWPHETTVVE